MSTEVYALAQRISRLVADYVFIHEAIFKFSLWKLPIPFLSEPIDYGDYRMRLHALLWSLERQGERIVGLKKSHLLPYNTAVLLELLREYVEALLETVDWLHAITEKLQKESEGERYRWRAYRQDWAAYKASIAKYRAIEDQVYILYARL
ncbi:hypothetical protein MYX77_05205 [Acidobacteriia bacterium AH_259_A11_L15]|nr:hypothetical protein [Acidobacteriia bacterium AH_259_A11_L15]